MTEADDSDRVVRVLVFALRHQPHKYGVVLDANGFADIDELVVGIRYSCYDWAALDRRTVEEAVNHCRSDRFEIRGNWIRASYGHSVRLESPGSPQPPPDVLWHGTPSTSLSSVLADGLLPMSRAHVHLTTDPEYAAQVAAMKGDGIVVRVHAKTAADGGIEFLRANASVWLSGPIPAGYLSLCG